MDNPPPADAEIDPSHVEEITGPNSSNDGWYHWPDQFCSPDGIKLEAPLTIEGPPTVAALHEVIRKLMEETTRRVR
jgi:hypothetical protein